MESKTTTGSQIDCQVIKPVVTNYEPERFKDKEQQEEVLQNLTKTVERLLRQGIMPQIGWKIVEDDPNGDVWYITDITYNNNILEIEATF